MQCVVIVGVGLIQEAAEFQSRSEPNTEEHEKKDNHWNTNMQHYMSNAASLWTVIKYCASHVSFIVMQQVWSGILSTA